ncbi:Transcription Factor IIF, Rap30/Rap74, interaction [Hirsutella rhossiliensis]|uniref:Transcription Factor IIF, Rap30/Rap74, interaction n=1 Tax=Hirsutella rhossiliensis TaxID=111463 RepID=A0A9P8MS60_9HYPO|nr:Transcription Factor IIF, Rap30/Rap74, interaction [Hirsutella rhossiliensis]KAH0960295.1 Transcription Factor IIF, Rap30/Rap74, interaction [Hirsutella rhossiliensis]
MSAPPRGGQNGVPRNTRKPNPLRPMRKAPRPANPLVAPSRKPAAKPSSKPAPNASRNAAKGPALEELRSMYGGWSEPPPQFPYTDIPIMTTKKALIDGARFHVMRFFQPRLNDKPVDPTDQDAFARPVTLHRRDARQPPPGRAVKAEDPEPPQTDELEAERLAQIRAEREAQRAMDQAKIAPVAKETNPKRPKKQKEEKTSFNRAPKSEAAKKESDLRYEEALPWHLEDADGKNVWVGNYVAALSKSSVAFMIDKSVFRMVPLEKWYKFTSKPPFQPFNIDQAEALMNKKMDVSRWVMKDEERKLGQSDLEATRRLFYGRGPMVKTESDTFKAASRLEKLEHDELDMSGDEFQDDDEAPHFERNDDEDTKDSKDRIRREQLGANLFGDGDEQEVDKELQEQLREELERQKYGKTTKKALIKRDREDIYESDNSEDNPWSSSSDDDSSDEDEEGNKEEDKKDADKKDADKKDAEGSKGTTTPQGKQKQGDLLKKSKSLKRAGSPTLSESSGNESSRKKLKKSAGPAAGSRSDTPLPQTNAPRRSKLGGAGPGSDGEVTAGELSDGAGPRKKSKLVDSSRKGTPAASRAGSPNPAQGGASPGSQTGSGIEPWEILEKIPSEGIAIGDLIKPFQGRVGDRPGQMPKGEWIKLVKQLCDYGPDKRLRRRK